MASINSWRRQIVLSSEPFTLVSTVEDMLAAQQQGRLVVGFDLEDTNPLGGEIAMIQAYYDLGVRSMLMTYNTENLAGFGCHAPQDRGLTGFGRAVPRGPRPVPRPGGLASRAAQHDPVHVLPPGSQGPVRQL